MTRQNQIQQSLRDSNKIHMLNNVVFTNLTFNENYNTCEETEENLTHNKDKKQSRETNQEM